MPEAESTGPPTEGARADKDPTGGAAEAGRPGRNLAAEVERLTRENQSLTDRLKHRGPLVEPAELMRLERENAALKASQARTEADRGPRAGTDIRYRRAGEKGSRPGNILSDGFVERQVKPGGFIYFAHIEYGDPEDMADRLTHTFQCTAPYDPLGAPGSWCYPQDEQARLVFDKAVAEQRRQAP
jgi:hypothetical protein